MCNGNEYPLDTRGFVKELFLAADRFDIMDLKKLAECDLLNEVSVENVAEVLMLFDSKNCEMDGLESKAVK
jgi:hypothetical protein